jgi:hypothetical protein
MCFINFNASQNHRHRAKSIQSVPLCLGAGLRDLADRFPRRRFMVRECPRTVDGGATGTVDVVPRGGEGGGVIGVRRD